MTGGIPGIQSLWHWPFRALLGEGFCHVAGCHGFPSAHYSDLYLLTVLPTMATGPLVHKAPAQPIWWLCRFPEPQLCVWAASRSRVFPVGTELCSWSHGAASDAASNLGGCDVSS